MVLAARILVLFLPEGTELDVGACENAEVRGVFGGALDRDDLRLEGAESEGLNGADEAVLGQSSTVLLK